MLDIYSGTNLHIPINHLILLDHLAAYLAAMIHNGIHLSPSAELSLPVCDGRKWSNDEKWTSKTHQIDLREECNGLDRLPQTHFISQNAVFPVEMPQTAITKPWKPFCKYSFTNG